VHSIAGQLRASGAIIGRSLHDDGLSNRLRGANRSSSIPPECLIGRGSPRPWLKAVILPRTKGKIHRSMPHGRERGAFGGLVAAPTLDQQTRPTARNMHYSGAPTGQSRARPGPRRIRIDSQGRAQRRPIPFPTSQRGQSCGCLNRLSDIC